MNSLIVRNNVVSELDNWQFVEFSLLVLYCLQTPEERNSRESIFRNGVGFCKMTGKFGPYFAEIVAYRAAHGVPLGECLNRKMTCRGEGRRPVEVEARECVERHHKQVERFIQFCGGLPQAMQAIAKEIPQIMGKCIENHAKKRLALPSVPRLN